MDARELLRRYLEQRRDLGEQELVLDRMDVDEVLRIVGALRGGASAAAPTSGGASAAAPTSGGASAVRPEAAPAPSARPVPPVPPAEQVRESRAGHDAPADREDRSGRGAPPAAGGADFDWRAALRAAGGAPDSAVSKPDAPREEQRTESAPVEGRPAFDPGTPRSAASGTGGAGPDAGPSSGDDMPARKASKTTSAARSGAASPRTEGAKTAGDTPATEEAFPAWLRGIDVPAGLAVGGRATELTDDHFTRLRTIDEVARAVHDCTRCPLYKTATHGVPGEGNPNAELVCVGEAPGAQEDETGRPFVGASGQLLTKILAAIKLSREEVFICNVLKHRPPGNRNPAPDEVEACSPYLLRQLELVKPKVIVTFGTFAAQTLLRTKTPIGKLREQVHLYHGIPLVVTYHPAALLRNPAWKRPTWNDVQLARRILDRAAGA